MIFLQIAPRLVFLRCSSFRTLKSPDRVKEKTAEVNISEMIVISVVYACDMGTAEICYNVRKYMPCVKRKKADFKSYSLSI